MISGGAFIEGDRLETLQLVDLASSAAAAECWASFTAISIFCIISTSNTRTQQRIHKKSTDVDKYRYYQIYRNRSTRTVATAVVPGTMGYREEHVR